MDKNFDNKNVCEKEENSQTVNSDTNINEVSKIDTILKSIKTIQENYNILFENMGNIKEIIESEENSIPPMSAFKYFVEYIVDMMHSIKGNKTMWDDFEEYIDVVRKYEDKTSIQKELEENNIPLQDIILEYINRKDFKYWKFSEILKDLKDMKHLLCKNLIDDIFERNAVKMQKLSNFIHELNAICSTRKIENASLETKEFMYEYNYTRDLAVCINYEFPYEITELYMNPMYNDKQRIQIMKGVRHNLTPEEIKLYANDIGFNDKCMREIRKGLIHGLTEEEVLLYATEEFNGHHEDMEIIREALEQRIPIEKVKKFANLKYTVKQKDEIRKAYKDKYDDDKMEVLLNPELSHYKIVAARKGFKYRLTKEQILYYIDPVFDDSASLYIFSILKKNENMWETIKLIKNHYSMKTLITTSDIKSINDGIFDKLDDFLSYKAELEGVFSMRPI